MTAPRVFTIPASVPFLPTLVRALGDGTLVPGFPDRDDPLALASATLYLPTRRACRLARDAFLVEWGGEATVLPRIVPIGDIDEDEIAFAEQAAGMLAAETLELPPAMGNFQRKILLARMILAWANAPAIHGTDVPLVANSPAAAFDLAGELAQLLDDMTTRGVPWDQLDDLVPGDMDTYWQLTLKFLDIARSQWPALLAEYGVIEAAARRDRLIEAETGRLKRAQGGPVIAAGSTGSMPSTARLLATIAEMPNGAVVLPGLDTALDEPSWQLILGRDGRDGEREVAQAAGHPQFALASLLRRMNITRAQVTTLGAVPPHSREALVSEALRPAASTDQWRDRLRQPDFAVHGDAALADVTFIAAAHAEEEALAIAVTLREAVHTAGKTAALVTPDRALARRVLAALERWNVPVDDSGGDPLPDTHAGIFALLAAEAALGGLAPVTLLALLKHPLLRLGKAAGAHDPAVSILERAVLRGPRPRAGTAGLTHALATLRNERGALHPADPRTALSEADIAIARTLADRLCAALQPLEHLTGKTASFAEFADRHRAVVIDLTGDAAGEVEALARRDGAALVDLFDAIGEEPATAAFPVTASEYPDLLRSVMADRIVRRPGAPGSRVRILGQLEARLQQADRMVLGGLVEGVWPPEPRSDPWLSRPMRQQLGLDLPERRIGLSAHDFAQALGAREIVLTAAAKRDGAPTVVSRFLQRLAAVAGERWNSAKEAGDKYLAHARALDFTAKPQCIRRPEPRPPLHARPTSFSVTEIEHWLRDPYTIYAKRILNLRPLDPVDQSPGARDRGTVMHEALAEFTQRFAAALPADPLAELLAIGKKHFAKIDDYPEARAFWWPRFMRIAEWFVDWERTKRRPRAATVMPEIDGRIALPVGTRTLTLRARADRIEQLTDGRYAILDYKTGRIPSVNEVLAGFAPQMTLEAAILRRGGFEGVPAGATVAELVYVAVKGGHPGGEEMPVKCKDGTPDDEADKARLGLIEYAQRFEDVQYPYCPLMRSQWSTRYGDYDHLARVKEWSATGGDSDGGTE
jgi:ATP-dependent helicase/nuclease subunit B